MHITMPGLRSLTAGSMQISQRSAVKTFDLDALACCLFPCLSRDAARFNINPIECQTRIF